MNKTFAEEHFPYLALPKDYVAYHQPGKYLQTGKSYWKGKAQYLLVLTSLDQLLFKLKILLTSFTKQATLMRRSTVLSLPLS